ncbi:MAG: PD40 domain-containing protein [Ardenticatenales bacterium]|nr:PD40 domain-containing protein [Ardenticatenales bacterium]
MAMAVGAVILGVLGSVAGVAAAPVGMHGLQSAPSPIVDVDVTDDVFVPAAVTVTVGSTVRWSNRGARLHSVTSDAGWFNWTLAPGRALRVRFLSTGEYRYHCVYHGAMTGRIVVVPGEAGSTPTATQPPNAPTRPSTVPTPGPVGPPVGPAQGGAIVFQDVAAAGGRTDLFVIAADGTGRRALTTTPQLTEAQPHWSPDRREVAYTATGGSGAAAQWRIEVVDVATGVRRAVTNGPAHFEPRWRPDGAWIAYTVIQYITSSQGQIIGGSGIAVVRPDGTGARLLFSATGSSQVIGNPSWSPDGRTLAFVLRAADGGNGADGELWALDLATSTTRRLFAHPGWDDVQPAWSPDGRRIAFASHASSVGRRPYAVWLLDLDTGTAGTVATHPDWSLFRPSWSPGGGWIIFNAEIATTPSRDVRLYYVQDGGGTVYGPLTTGAEPDWAGVTSFEPPPPPLTPEPTSTPGSGTGTSEASSTTTPTATFPPPPLTPLPLPSPPSETSVPGPPPTFPVPSETPEPPTATTAPTETSTATSLPDTPTMTPSPDASATTPGGEATPTGGAGGRRVWLPVAFG